MRGPQRTIDRVARIVVVAGCAALAASCAEEGAAPLAPSPVQHGRTIAQRDCSTCHAIRELGSSPRADAPPLREVLDRYSPARIEQSFREGMIVGHRDMPLFEFSQDEVDALIAYLQDIRE